MRALNSCRCCSSDHTEGSGTLSPKPAAWNEGGGVVLRGSAPLVLREPEGGVGSVVVSPTNSLKVGRFGRGSGGGSTDARTRVW